MTDATQTCLGIIGIGGRMGREIVAVAADDPHVTVVGGTIRPGTTPTPLDATGTIALHEDLATLLPTVDVLIDFSTPATSVSAARLAAESGIPIVIGTTGLSADQLTVLREISTRTALFYARNTAHGVNALLRLLPQIAAAFADYDVELIEQHHRHKKDAPSGTALALAEAILQGLGEGEHPYVFGREGFSPRKPGEIGMHSVRGGGNTGEHTIIFASDQEEIRITHRALNRSAFAAGAIRAARELVGKPAGWYGPDVSSR